MKIIAFSWYLPKKKGSAILSLHTFNPSKSSYSFDSKNRKAKLGEDTNAAKWAKVSIKLEVSKIQRTAPIFSSYSILGPTLSK